MFFFFFFFFFQAEDGIRDLTVTGVQTCALPIYVRHEVDVLRRIVQHRFGREKPDYRRDLRRPRRRRRWGLELSRSNRIRGLRRLRRWWRPAPGPRLARREGYEGGAGDGPSHPGSPP